VPTARYIGASTTAQILFSLLITLQGLVCIGCSEAAKRRIAVFPRTTGATLWEAEHAGADAAAVRYRYKVYWNAPTHEDDVEGQVALLEKACSNRYSGVVLAPDHALALLTPIRRVLAAGTPVVIVSSPLALPPDGRLSYIVTDEELMGKMAARRIGTMVHGSGKIALLGLDPGVAGLMSRVRAFERELHDNYPGVTIVFRGAGAFNAAEAQEATVAALCRNPRVSALFSLTAVSTRAAYLTLRSRNEVANFKLIGCEQDGLLIGRVQAGEIDAVLAEDTYAMGYRAVKQIADRAAGHSIPGVTVLPPIMITRENAFSSRVQQLTAGFSLEPQ
jgi:ribose transport system substrate-binding protein